MINGTGNYRLAHQPFGGYKYSGVGREGAVSTLEEMTQQKMISFKGNFKLNHFLPACDIIKTRTRKWKGALSQ